MKVKRSFFVGAIGSGTTEGSAVLTAAPALVAAFPPIDRPRRGLVLGRLLDAMQSFHGRQDGM
jgi:hypothetical protein